MSVYVVVGAGPVGVETARLLGEAGHDVTITSRSVNSQDRTNVRAVRADATDAEALTQLCKGADAVFMCAMAPYDRWPTDFFPIMDGVTRAAENVGTKLIVLGNLYGYGSNPEGLLRPDQPLDPSSRKGTVRTIMWQRALRASVPAIEVRASDYLGQGAVTYFSLLALPSLLASKPVTFLGDLDAKHAWSFTKDVARTLVATAGYTGAWDRAFHVPSQHVSPRELILRTAELLGKEPPALGTFSQAQMEEFGMHELVEMSYLLETPLLLDASETESHLGVHAQEIDVMIADMIEPH
ncbi:nucleoside-diphosphate-sugar epimerase [Rhizobium pisi]|uniref:NAD-dependent epimerase/dehydratase family protein n=1 Tax=Rhizobium pisi TaxID=574561 RepID=A0A427MCP1_9HYPH|nr:NAD-dependent epimerase/dehydratase family protein [Rhizobium pisi]MBB3137952.1 nucleoside-diphosphate-sugar epimerase [Rhizobium pisi]RSB65718.1 NAD-dependent epimerase/dehydratase family protein [Rhizobium pisi]TCA48312.1 NAD-dependent epimerase/dehydratase family protein [Rhizobium pisi]